MVIPETAPTTVGCRWQVAKPKVCAGSQRLKLAGYTSACRCWIAQFCRAEFLSGSPTCGLQCLMEEPVTYIFRTEWRLQKWDIIRNEEFLRE